MPDQTIKEWIDSRLNVLSRDWESKADDLGEVEKDINHFLRPVLDSLGYPYSIDPTTGESVVVVTPEISIIGLPGYNTYDFKAKLKSALAEKEVTVCKPYISGISVYEPLLKQAIQDLQKLDDEFSPITKCNKNSKMLAAIVQSVIETHLDDKSANDVTITPLVGEEPLCEIKYCFFKNIYNKRFCYSVRVNLNNYSERIDCLLKTVSSIISCTETIKFLSKFNIGQWTSSSDKIPNYTNNRPNTFYDEIKMIHYQTPKILQMVNSATKSDVGSLTVYRALEECGYKYYFSDCLRVVLANGITLLRKDNHCWIDNNGENSDSGYHINNNEFALFLRIIAKLPSKMYMDLINITSFKNIVTEGISCIMRDYFLPEYCEVHFNHRDIYFYDGIVFPYKYGDDPNSMNITVYISNNKTFISSWWTAVKNVHLLKELVCTNNECRFICD